MFKPGESTELRELFFHTEDAHDLLDRLKEELSEFVGSGGFRFSGYAGSFEEGLVKKKQEDYYDDDRPEEAEGMIALFSSFEPAVALMYARLNSLSPPQNMRVDVYDARIISETAISGDGYPIDGGAELTWLDESDLRRARVATVEISLANTATDQVAGG